MFAGLLVGAMLPYWFSAMTMKSVGKAALAMVEEVRRQFATIPGIMEGSARPDYRLCVEISTQVRTWFTLCRAPFVSQGVNSGWSQAKTFYTRIFADNLDAHYSAGSEAVPGPGNLQADHREAVVFESACLRWQACWNSVAAHQSI